MEVKDSDIGELATEAYHVATAMRRQGGGFVKNLGEALANADLENRKKIKDTWPEYWKEYLAVGKKMNGVD